MRTKHRVFLVEDWNRRFDSVARRIAETTELELVPWLRPGLSISELRRTVARLRSGAIRRISPQMLADIIERFIEKELLVRWIMTELSGNIEIERSIEERDENERVRRLVAGFHRMKKSPEASDPGSPAAQRVRRLHRERRNELGRPRRRRK